MAITIWRRHLIASSTFEYVVVLDAKKNYDRQDYQDAKK